MFHKTVGASISDLSRAAQQRALNLERRQYIEARETGEISEMAASKLLHLLSKLQTTAAAFTKAFLNLEGELTPILVSLVSKDQQV